LHVAREFGSDQRSFVYVRDDALWTPGKLAALEQLHDELRRLPFVERIDDLFTLPTVIGIDGQFYAQPLLPAAPSDEAAPVDRASSRSKVRSPRAMWSAQTAKPSPSESPSARNSSVPTWKASAGVWTQF
jgi:hypothetical protein